jgi:uncharacterized iron-regulated protein
MPAFENWCANPIYCQEWDLKQPNKLVVCNLPTANMSEIDGRIEQHVVLAGTREQIETDPHRRVRRKRMANFLLEGAQKSLPIRVIVLDGRRQRDYPNAKTHVSCRALSAKPLR